MMVSFAAIDPPFRKLGETQTTRPPTSEVTFTFPCRVTPPVRLTVSACSVGAGWITATVGLACSGARSEMGSRSTRLGACAKYKATPMAANIKTSCA